MGKAKRNRIKLHLPAAVRKKNQEIRQQKNEGNHSGSMKMDTSSMVDRSDSRSVARSGVKSNPFTGVHITPSILQQKLPDFDTQSRVSNKTLRGLNLKKKEKLKIRHEAFVEKIKTIQTEKKTAAEKRRRRKTPVVGDMSGLSDSLPTLEFLMREMEEKEHKQAPTKERSVLKERERMKRGRADMATFHQVLSHAAYKSDPGATIREHLANKMKLEQNP